MLRSALWARVQKQLLRRGWRMERRYPIDLTPHAREIIVKVEPRSGWGFELPAERMFALIEATSYIVDNNIPGAIVETGVFRGASMMAVAHELVRLGETERELYMFDTFTGMPEPGERDVSLSGQRAQETWQGKPADWLAASVEDVRANMLSTGYREAGLHFVKGMVQETIPAQAPDEIALLRLDTDWYESTKHELEHLYPRVAGGGVLIVDDYGHWAGARRAVDEYFRGRRVFLSRLDYTARLAIKPLEPTQDTLG